MEFKKVVAFGLIGFTILSGSCASLASNITKNNTNKKVITQQLNQTVKINVKQIKTQTKSLKIDMKIPQISGMKDVKYQNALNAKIISNAMNLKKQMEKESKNAKNYELILNYSFTSSGNMFSLGIQNYTYTGGANGMPATEYYNVLNETKAQELKLKDLFKNNADYKKAINTEIKRQIKEQMAKDPNKTYFAENEDGFKTISDKQGFYLENKTLVICFTKYEIAPGAMGEPEFKIPFDTFKSILK